MKTHQFQPTPYPYQAAGALAAINADKNLIADEPGVGKTLQALAVARLTNAERVLIICPPILATNWEKETTRTNNVKNINGELKTITAKTKTKNMKLPNKGYLIIPDSLIVARKLTPTLSTWQPQLMILDEAHRYKNPKAARTKQILQLSRHTEKTLCLTGTPIVSSPLDILPLLQATGHLQHFAKTPYDFVNRYTYENHFGARIAKPSMMGELHEKLEAHVWTRRTKNQVLAELPTKSRYTHYVDPTPGELDTALKEINTSIDEWLEDYPQAPSTELVAQYAANSLRFVARLRKTTGLAKIEAATDWIIRHHEGRPDEPLIVWIHHSEVTQRLQEALHKANQKLRLAVIDGKVTGTKRDQIVEAFQSGTVDVLIAQISAAGVGLTLTRSSTALFVETDWTPALVVQAEDRIHRISQQHPVAITTLVAVGTLDERIHEILQETMLLLNDLTPGSDHTVSEVKSEGMRVKELVTELIEQRIREKYPPEQTKTRLTSK